MSPAPDRADPPDNIVSCEECQKNVPLSEALTTEAQDYVLYFCGVECFELWRKKAERKYGKDKPGLE